MNTYNAIYVLLNFCVKCGCADKVIHEDDRIFGEWSSPSTIGLGHTDWTIQLALCNILFHMQYNLQKIGNSD